MICTEDCVPQEHLLRKIDAAMDFNKIYDFADENAINEYAENIDLITFLTTLKQNCGLDLTSLLLGTMQ